MRIEADTSFTGEWIARVLTELLAHKGKPQVLQIDKGPELRGKVLDLWADQNEVKLHFIEPGKPTQNGKIKSFNGKLRDECLNMEWFTFWAKHAPRFERGDSTTARSGRIPA